MKKINEIFYSLQGEGYHTGVPAVFVRFSGCNLRCSFCDTEHENGEMMSDDEIINEVLKYSHAKLIVITGGEPSLFITHQFIDSLKRATSMIIAIETNGTHSIPENVDWVTLSPKGGFEGGDNQGVVITRCNELKVVYLGQDLNQYFQFDASHYFLQPCGTSDEAQNKENINRTVDAILNDTRWRLSLQTHKMLNVR